MNAAILHYRDDDSRIVRLGRAAAIVVAIHIALIAFAIAWYTRTPPPGVASPAILIELSGPSASPTPQPLDLAPGPTMQEADAPSMPPDAAPSQKTEEPLTPTPLQEKPVVEAPPEQKVQQPNETAEAEKPMPDRPKVTPVKKPKPVTDAKLTPDAVPAPRTSAAPKAERQAPAASAVSAGASAAAIASYKQLIAAHLQRFKQYPPGAKSAGQQGVSRLSFSLSRSGQVLGSGLAGSSGSAALDGETLAMVRRAQPFPAMPAEIKQASMSFVVPVSFSIR